MALVRRCVHLLSSVFVVLSSPSSSIPRSRPMTTAPSSLSPPPLGVHPLERLEPTLKGGGELDDYCCNYYHYQHAESL